MNVLIISQCSKRALVETRRILDQFAERRGERAWQTPITQAGLDTMRKMLKRTARKNTAVACHWIRGRDHSELVWIVGDARRFNEQGAVPTDTTERNILRSDLENDWRSAEDIKLLAVLASLFHDFGKASLAFEKKLRNQSGRPVADAYRHEWVSLRLFESFVTQSSSDFEWLERLSTCDASNSCQAISDLVRDDQKGAKSPFRKNHLPPLARMVGWLIVSHHRIPAPPEAWNAQVLRRASSILPIVADWNGARSDATDEEKANCWSFPKGLPFDSQDWTRRTRSCALAILRRTRLVDESEELLCDPFVMHMSRMALMLADHHYSAEPSNSRYGDESYPLYANTDRETRELKQRLDEHLIGVSCHARRVVRALPRLDGDLPRIARHKGFKKRTTVEKFRWQDRAYDLAVSLRDRTATHGFFGINMASTGCGKTLANGRIMYGLADPTRGARFTIALGLRTLTLQTGQAYRDRLHLGDDDLGVLVGGAAVRELFFLGQEQNDFAQAGSESAEPLVAEESYVHYEGATSEGPLGNWLQRNSDANRLVQAPILTCTVDHLVPATEGLRGGRQIAPMLRLMTSDLVLDEPDDFDLDDLPALSRLVYWAGLLGSRVLLSSATLAPSLVKGLFDAYFEGRRHFQNNRGEPGTALCVPCAWFDEFAKTSINAGQMSDFATAHDAFVAKRLTKLRAGESRRKVERVPVVSQGSKREEVCASLAEQLPTWMCALHKEHHTEDPASKKRVSFGLVRMANIDPLIRVARNLYEQQFIEGFQLHLCVYHSNHPLLMRSAIETMLDAVLKRGDELRVFENKEIRGSLNQGHAKDHMFVVLASPVSEVGRDHDYDWAIVEPSSMRSIIQLAGRIRRHRPGACTSSNILLLNRNLKALEGRRPAFCRPGFERVACLHSYDLFELLKNDQLTPLDSGPRIRERPTLEPCDNLVDLEQARLRELMLGDGSEPTAFTIPDWYRSPSLLSGVLQTVQRFPKGRGGNPVCVGPRGR